MSTPVAATTLYATFRVDSLLLGIPVIEVQEVIRSHESTVVPLAPSAVEGLINLRGQIVTVIDTRRSLGLPPVENGVKPMHMVVRTEEGVVSLLADDIGDVMNVKDAVPAPVPDNMPERQRELIESVYDFEEGLLLALNTSRLLQNACQ